MALCQRCGTGRLSDAKVSLRIEKISNWTEFSKFTITLCIGARALFIGKRGGAPWVIVSMWDCGHSPRGRNVST